MSEKDTTIIEVCCHFNEVDGICIDCGAKGVLDPRKSKKDSNKKEKQSRESLFWQLGVGCI